MRENLEKWDWGGENEKGKNSVSFLLLFEKKNAELDVWAIRNPTLEASNHRATKKSSFLTDTQRLLDPQNQFHVWRSSITLVPRGLNEEWFRRPKSPYV
jgi:hypothetical protein